MPSGVVTCQTCGRDLRAGLLVCPHDGTRLGPAPQKKNASDLLRGPGDAPTIENEHHTIDTLPTARPLTGQKLGDYVVGTILGTGGMGEVYEGEQPVIGKKVAIKVLKQSVAQDKVNVQRMLSEARAVASIRHRSICDVFNFGTLDDGRPYIVMEYLDGEPLDQILRKRNALAPLEAVELLEEICSALAAAHARNIVHRDLKPGNIFVVSDIATKQRYVKLLDFGLAKDHLQTRDGGMPATMEGFVVGTPDYIAPEQARGLKVTPKTDLYSLGVMAFEMLTGRLPFIGDTAIDLMNMHVNEQPPEVGDLVNGLPPLLERLVDSMLRKEPSERPESADAVRRQLVAMHRELREGNTQTGARGQEISKRTEPMSPVMPDSDVELPTDPSEVGRRDALQDEVRRSRRFLAGALAFLVLVLVGGIVALAMAPGADAPKPLKSRELQLQPQHDPVPGTSSPP